VLFYFKSQFAGEYPGALSTLLHAMVIECKKDITKKWQQELGTHCPKAAVVLVGTKMDLRDDKETNEHLKQKKLKPISYPSLILFSFHLFEPIF
jgi:hypothetical protein